MSYVPVINPRSVFGEVLVSEISPVLQAHFVYGEPRDFETFEATGGSVTYANEMIVCQTGTSVGGYGVGRTSQSQLYQAGEGNEFRFTAIFDVANALALSRQSAGPFNLTDGMGFGYNGADFGVLYEHHGAAEIQTLSLSAGASGNETLTITIAGTEYTVNVTSGTANQNAYEIEASLKSQVAGYRFDHIGDTVVCQCESAATQTNDFTLVNETGGGTCAGSFTQNTAGAAKTEEWVNQADWNQNTLLSGTFTLDPSKLNVYRVEFGYLGAAGIRYYVLNPDTLEWVHVHTVKIANSTTKPLFYQPSMRVGWVAASLGSSGTNLTVKGASLFAGVQGKRNAVEPSRSLETTNTTVNTTFINMLTIKNRLVFGDKPNQGEIKPLVISASTDSAKGVLVQLISEATVSGVTSYTQVASDSIGIYATDAGAVSGGVVIASRTISAAEDGIIDISDFAISKVAGETLTVAAKSLATGTPNDDVTITLTWREDK